MQSIPEGLWWAIVTMTTASLLLSLSLSFSLSKLVMRIISSTSKEFNNKTWGDDLFVVVVVVVLVLSRLGGVRRHGS